MNAQSRKRFCQLIFVLLISIGGLVFTAQARAQGVPCVAGFAGPYPCNNVDLLSFVPTTSLTASSGADIWGWTDPQTGREYALQSLSNATAFVDVSEPTEPVFVGFLPAPATNFLWRHVQVYRNHAYIVGDFSPVSTDDSNPDAIHGLQIFDLTRLRDAAPLTEFEEDNVYTGFDESHNLAINEDTGFAYALASDTCGGGLHMMDLKPDPLNPEFVGCFDDNGLNVHDAQCVVYHGPDEEHQGREICFNSNESELDIVDVTDKSNPVVLSRRTYEGLGYVHQGWLTEDHAQFALSDETDELNALTALNPHNTHTYLWDMSDLDNPVQLPTYVGPTAAIDHNLFIKGRFVYETNYTAGLRILDAADIAVGSLEQIAFFDTHPEDNATAFAGSWSNYPFFDSGIVVVSNIEDGLYVLGPNLPADGGAVGDRTNGGGWLAASDGGKLNFGFEAEQTGDGPRGDLEFKDKNADVRIRIDEVTVVGPVQGDCGSIQAADNALEFRGTGTFNEDDAASFRVCVVDNGEPGHSRASDTPDRFHIECRAGCDYDSSERAADDGIDAGNIGVRRGESGSSQSQSQADTLILAPVLLDEGVAGAAQPLQVKAFGANEEPVDGVEVTLTRSAASGWTETLNALTGPGGIALFDVTIPLETSTYQATAGEAESNLVTVEPVLD